MIRFFAWFVFLCIFFAVYVRLLERRTVFLPVKEILISPGDYNLAYEDVYFLSGDVKLNGWFVPSIQNKGTILFFHGNAGNIGDRVGKIILFHQLGLNVFIVDYRGFGRSEGRSTEQSMYEDAHVAYEYLLARGDIDHSKIIIYGVSLGGVAAIDLAASREIPILIVDSSFSEAYDMAKLIIPFVPRFLLSVKLDNIGKIDSIKAPKLFIHSLEDQTVPYHLGKKLYDAAPAPKQFLDIRGAHTNVHMEDRHTFVNGVEKFLKEQNIL